jgi:hypothetical protein
MCISCRLRVRVGSPAFCRRRVSASRSAKKTRSGSPSLPSANADLKNSRDRCQYSNDERPATQSDQVQWSLNGSVSQTTQPQRFEISQAAVQRRAFSQAQYSATARGLGGSGSPAPCGAGFGLGSPSKRTWPRGICRHQVVLPAALEPSTTIITLTSRH